MVAPITLSKPFPQESLDIDHRSRLSFYNRLLYEFSTYLEAQITERLKDIEFVIDEPFWIRSQRKDLIATSKIVDKFRSKL